MTTKIYEATRAHHFIQKLKVLISNGRVKEHETKEAIDEIESFVNHILKELGFEPTDNGFAIRSLTKEQQDE